ncbi:hypothetical protein BKA70DRAFT_1153029 [Coprinopsis sp. MPI-PUGE-AT-0042]|nr:hypothetical protein BKA70DRAFT_1153029 [Coprinopsis sp. MPI-PUGE-AT-0042]
MDEHDHCLATRDSSNEAVDPNLCPPVEGGVPAMPLIQSLSGVKMTGGSIHVVGASSHHQHQHQHQHEHYHQHHHQPKQTHLQPTNDIPAILERVPNHRNIHIANLGRATPGTGPLFPQWDEFCEWVSTHGLLKTMWGSGMPGAGKTIFASIVINEVETHAQASESAISVGYIYFRYSDNTTATVRDFLEVLVKQTVERHENCLPIFHQIYERHIRERSQPSEPELLLLLQRFAEVMEATFYFLEALDEAPADIQFDLLEKLESLNVKLFITSRPLTALQARFPAVHRFPLLAQDRDLDLHITKEISRNMVLQTILGEGGPMVREKIASTIKRKCGGMFLHASLQLGALRGCASICDVEKTLEDFPPRIEDVYQQTWNRILDQTPRLLILAKSVLVWVLCATRSLKIEDLRRAVATCPDTHQFDSSRLVDGTTLMGLCHGLVNIEEETNHVRFVHYTAKDVVQRFISESCPSPHSLPALTCLALLTECGFQGREFPVSFSSMLTASPLAPYAYEAWSTHVHESLGDRSVFDRLAHFIQGCREFPVQDIETHGPPCLGCMRPRLGCMRPHAHRSPSFHMNSNNLGPLHMVAYFNLPIAVAGSAHLQALNKPIRFNQIWTTPLLLAIFKQSVGSVKELLSLADTLVNAADAYGRTPVMWALSLPGRRHKTNFNQAIAALVLAHPETNVNAQDSYGRSALMLASEKPVEAAVTLLLAHPKIKPNQADPDGKTALMHASYHGSRGVVLLLLADPRVKVNLRSKGGKTALDIAQKWGHDEIVQHLRAHLADQSLMTFLRRYLPFP